MQPRKWRFSFAMRENPVFRPLYALIRAFPRLAWRRRAPAAIRPLPARSPALVKSIAVPRVQLLRSGLEVSRLGLGTSRLHYLSTDESRVALIHGALDMGVTHFDTARLYGDGLAERVLGKALKGRRGSATIATKFGLLPSAVIEALGSAGAPLRVGRALLRRMGFLRQPRRAWTPAVLQRSLHASLKALATDRVDILFLHDPRRAEIGEELVAALAMARQSGKIRHLGVAGDAREAAAILAAFPGQFDIVQTPEDGWDAGLVPDFTFGVLNAGPQRLGAAGPSDGDVRARLAHALLRRPSGALLAGTSRLGHLRALAEAATP